MQVHAITQLSEAFLCLRIYSSHVKAGVPGIGWKKKFVIKTPYGSIYVWIHYHHRHRRHHHHHHHHHRYYDYIIKSLSGSVVPSQGLNLHRPSLLFLLLFSRGRHCQDCSRISTVVRYVQMLKPFMNLLWYLGPCYSIAHKLTASV
jgi:hypothetical protein